MEPGRLRFELRSIKGWMSHPRKGWQSAFQRRKDRGETENLLEPFFIWERMNAARNSRQTIYIYGTSGSGKTSFVEDFLARRRYCYIDMADTATEELAQSAGAEMVNARLCAKRFSCHRRTGTVLFTIKVRLLEAITLYRRKRGLQAEARNRRLL